MIQMPGLAQPLWTIFHSVILSVRDIKKFSFLPLQQLRKYFTLRYFLSRAQTGTLSPTKGPGSPQLLFMSFLSAKWQIKFWNSWPASFAWGIQGRVAGGLHCIGGPNIYYLLSDKDITTARQASVSWNRIPANTLVLLRHSWGIRGRGRG